MIHVFFLLCLCLVFTGCPTREPVSRSLVLTHSPEAAYACALQALTQMGATITHSDKTTGVLSAQVHRAVTLTVVLTPRGTGTVLAVTGVVKGNTVAFGSLTEVDDYLRLVQQL